VIVIIYLYSRRYDVIVWIHTPHDINIINTYSETTTMTTTMTMVKTMVIFIILLLLLLILLINNYYHYYCEHCYYGCIILYRGIYIETRMMRVQLNVNECNNIE